MVPQAGSGQEEELKLSFFNTFTQVATVFKYNFEVLLLEYLCCYVSITL